MKKLLSIFFVLCALMARATETGVYSGSVTIAGTAYTDTHIYILPGTEPNTLTCVVGEVVRVNVPEADISLSAQAVNANYDFVNGGFEGAWSSNEPQGWHSFGSATGGFAGFVSGNTGQFTKSDDIRPGSSGSQSARIQSKSVLGVKANGNCTNGRINAGSMTASDAANNYNFSDPGSSAYNTPFVGQPDSLVFWAKYIPADQNPSNSSNKARAHAVITTNARYQDPESSDYSAVKIADAEINYTAGDMGWQRLSVPFRYYNISPDQAAYILMTFTTNAQQGGGTTSGSTVDNIYLDDVQMIYNYGLKSVKLNGQKLTFANKQASVDLPFSDSYAWEVTTDGKGAKVIIGYDAETYKACIYVLANNYAQAQAYAIYTVQMTAPEPVIPTTTYAYSAETCSDAPYSDDLFQGLTESGEYRDTLENIYGGDSIVILTLTVHPTYLFEEQIFIMEQDTVWRGRPLIGLPAADEPYLFYDSLKTTVGCDSIYQLSLYVSTVPRTFGTYAAQLCEGDSVIFEGVTYKEAFEGDILMEQKNQYGGDSIVHLTVMVLPHYLIEQTMTMVHGADRTWEGIRLGTLAPGTMTMSVSYYAEGECDSTRVLHLTVLPTYVPNAGKDSVVYSDIFGRFDGELTQEGDTTMKQSVYLLPGTMDSTVTFVLPDFVLDSLSLGAIVLPNIPMDAYGQLRLEGRTYFFDALQERASITFIAYSAVNPTQAQVNLYIEMPSMLEGLFVRFKGQAVRQNNYSLMNGGFEGAWTNNEPAGWHSFVSCSGPMKNFVNTHVEQFVLSNEVRPDSKGAQSALLASSFLLNTRVNGNCTNGQIHVSSSTPDDAALNYNFSDPENAGFNTPLHGRPDSIVFWARYIPADRDAANSVNKARMNAVITTDARYQDPETFDSTRIGSAAINYAATPSFGWQRIAVPFTYRASMKEQAPAYILTTFTTNETPGGGSSYTVTTDQYKYNVVDSVYVDDAELVYNKQLNAFYVSGEALLFENHVASIADTYCDDCETYKAVAQGVSTQRFIAFDPNHRCIYVYVIADDFVQNKAYNIYRIEFSDSQTEELKPITQTEGCERVTMQPMRCIKQLYKGQIVIVREDGSMYDLLGRKIQ